MLVEHSTREAVKAEEDVNEIRRDRVMILKRVDCLLKLAWAFEEKGTWLHSPKAVDVLHCYWLRMGLGGASENRRSLTLGR